MVGAEPRKRAGRLSLRACGIQARRFRVEARGSPRRCLSNTPVAEQRYERWLTGDYDEEI